MKVFSEKNSRHFVPFLIRSVSIFIFLTGIVYASFDYRAERAAHVGLQYLKVKKPEKTIELVSGLTSVMPWRGRLWHLWGTALLRQDDSQKAIEKFERALQTRFNYMLNIHYAIALENLYEFDAAEKQLQHVLDYASSYDAAEEILIRIFTKKTLLELAKSASSEQFGDDKLRAALTKAESYSSFDFKGPYFDWVYAELLYRLNEEERFNSWFETAHSDGIKKWKLMFSLRETYGRDEYEKALTIAEEIIEPPVPHVNVLIQTFEILKKKAPPDKDLRERYNKIIASLTSGSGPRDR